MTSNKKKKWAALLFLVLFVLSCGKSVIINNGSQEAAPAPVFQLGGAISAIFDFIVSLQHIWDNHALLCPNTA